jgi:hypothetical protein
MHIIKYTKEEKLNNICNLQKGKKVLALEGLKVWWLLKVDYSWSLMKVRSDV